MPTVRANRIEIFYEEAGPSNGPVVLLIMGLALQMTAWPPEFLQRLHQAGLRTIRFDNRDVGLSEKFKGRGAPNLIWQTILSRLRLRGLASYNLRHMAEDAEGLLEALEIPQAHVIGVSMGGMIAQILAAVCPQRVRSLTAIMTSTNGPGVPGPRLDVARQLFRPGPPTKDFQVIVDRAIRTWNLIGTPNGGRSPEELRSWIEASVRRSHDPGGQKRQTAAIVDTGDLRKWTRKIQAPTLVIHGDADPLVNIAGGKDVAANIPDARLEIVEGMAHDLPPVHLDHLTEMICSHVRAVEQNAAASA